MKKNVNSSFFIILILMISCNHKETASNTEQLPLPIVSIVHPNLGNIQKKKQINGQVVYLNKTTITAPITGYVTTVNTAIGSEVRKGDLLFRIQTKESRALQNSSVSTDTEFGIIPVFASTSGFVNTLNIPKTGVFVSEGNTMASIVTDADLAIQANAPFVFSKELTNNNDIEIELANKEILIATFFRSIPVVDPISQTQQVLFKLKKHTLLPENLNVIVTFTTYRKENSTLLPKEAVLTNETQDKFWIMKVTKDSIAVKIPIQKGLETANNVEILNPVLKQTDVIIQKGAFGLPDSVKVIIK